MGLVILSGAAPGAAQPKDLHFANSSTAYSIRARHHIRWITRKV
jgi:hypothetical protein